MLGIEVPLSFLSIVAAFSNAGTELWENVRAIFTDAPTQWGSPWAVLAHLSIWPYLVGGILPGLAVSLLFYWITIPIVRTYQKMRGGKAEGADREATAAGTKADCGSGRGG